MIGCAGCASRAVLRVPGPARALRDVRSFPLPKLGGRKILKTKRRVRVLVVAITLALVSFGAPDSFPGRDWGQNQTTWTLEGVLKQLDAGAKEFRSLTADIERTKVTVVVNDRSTET